MLSLKQPDKAQLKLFNAGGVIGFLIASFVALLPTTAAAGGGPLGIDHRLSQSDTGIWRRSNQNALQDLGILGDLGFALWEGGDTRLGKTAWQSVDSMTLSAVVANVAKPVFGRQRPTQTDDPNQWFKGGGSFPSGEVSTITGIVTPYVLEYQHDYPAVWALELLPAYDAVARMKSRGHWQTDVLAGFAIGTGSGYLAHSRDNPFILGFLPGGFTVGFKKQF
jgi:membrane-associated phospholipid phosphatase